MTEKDIFEVEAEKVLYNSRNEPFGYGVPGATEEIAAYGRRMAALELELASRIPAVEKMLELQKDGPYCCAALARKMELEIRRSAEGLKEQSGKT